MNAVSYRIYIAIFLFSSYLSFTLWVYTYGTSGDPEKLIMSKEAYQGKLLYQQMNCASCHQIFGLGGYLGPELTSIMSDKGKNLNYVASFLKYGSKQMPAFDLDSLQVKELVAYLSYVDAASGEGIQVEGLN